MKFNFSTLLRFEEMTGKALNLTTITETKNNLTLAYIVTHERDSSETFDQFVDRLSVQELTDINNQLAPRISNFFSLPPTAESHVSEPEDTEGDEKN